MDGTFKYSSVLLIQVKNNDVFNVLNNPVTDKINIKLQLSAPQQVQISLFDMNGRMVKRSNINAQAGSMTYTVTGIEKLPKGMYVVEAIVNRERFTEKIVKN